MIDKSTVLEIKEKLKNAYQASDLEGFKDASTNFLKGIGIEFCNGQQACFNFTSSVNQQVVAQLASTPDSEIEEIFARSRKAQKIWGSLPVITRQEFFAKLKTEMAKYDEHFKVAITLDMGKSITSANGELTKASEWCDWAISSAVRDTLFTVRDRKTAKQLDISQPIANDIPIDIESRKALGIVTAMTSSNYPLALFMGPFTSALITGSSFIYKASEKTPSCSFLMKHTVNKVLDSMGLEDLTDKLFTVVYGREQKVIEAIVMESDEFIFIGGGIGHKFHQARIAAGKGERATLELGGIAPTIVMNSFATDQKTVDMLYKAQTDNCGQRCTRLTILLLERGKAYETLLPELEKKYVAENRIGNPFDSAFEFGPMIYADGDPDMSKVIETAKSLGARVVGGEKLKGFNEGCLVKPALIIWSKEQLQNKEVRKLICETELFCPLTHVFEIDNLRQGILLCRELKYRLAASLLTNEAHEIAEFSKEQLFGEVCYDIPPKDLSPISGHGGAPDASGRKRLGGTASLIELTKAGESEKLPNITLARDIIHNQTGLM